MHTCARAETEHTDTRTCGHTRIEYPRTSRVEGISSSIGDDENAARQRRSAARPSRTSVWRPLREMVRRAAGSGRGRRHDRGPGRRKCGARSARRERVAGVRGRGCGHPEVRADIACRLLFSRGCFRGGVFSQSCRPMYAYFLSFGDGGGLWRFRWCSSERSERRSPQSRRRVAAESPWSRPAGRRSPDGDALPSPCDFRHHLRGLSDGDGKFMETHSKI